jgi:hypothetical protein
MGPGLRTRFVWMKSLYIRSYGHDRVIQATLANVQVPSN